jgi:uncharacterized membrane protein
VKSRIPVQGARPTSITELTRRNVHAIAQIEEAAQANRRMANRVADWITRFAGSMLFVYLHVVWFASWILVNTLSLVPASWRFDPFPFTFLTLVVSLEAIFLSAFILISQNHEERLAERRSHLELQMTLLSEQENSKMLSMLETIQRKLGIENDLEAQRLEEATEPAEIAQEIDEELGSPNDN